MIILVWLAASAAIIAFVVYIARKQLKPKELRGDWWPRFEAEFREYVQGWEEGAGIRRRDVRSRSRPPNPT